MEYHQLEEIKQTVAESIEKHVNGRIREVMVNQEILSNKLDNYIINDNEWKKNADPYLQGLVSLSIGSKILVWIAIAVSSVGGAYLMIKSLFK